MAVTVTGAQNKLCSGIINLGDSSAGSPVFINDNSFLLKELRIWNEAKTEG